MARHFITDREYALADCFERTDGRVFMNGTQALARIMLDQARRDRLAGLTTAGFVSGYRGSPLGAVDKTFWSLGPRLTDERIVFRPAINEDLAATAILGAQQAHLDPHATVEGVFSMWYGKGPGVDRSGDALKHGNAYGTAAKGGVLVVAGDDHGCVSSSMPHQSDVAFMAWFMPTLNPASIAEYQQFGAYGFALSRFSGTWVGFKAISETVESGRSVQLAPDRVFRQPDFVAPTGGLHVRLGERPSTELETRITAKLDAVRAFVEANPLDHALYDIPEARFGIVTTGKAHLDTMEALRLLGFDERRCRALGIDIYKVGMVWPLARRDALRFAAGKEELLVIEEKRGIIESQLKEHFYDVPGDKPARMVGKHDETNAPLVPWTGELSPKLLLPLLAARLDAVIPGQDFRARAMALTETAPPMLSVSGAARTPYFCSGCPHNTSTKLPQGSQAASGIGCHVMASWMDRDTTGFAQMGGEGVAWSAASEFNGKKHMFQNIGEGTWYHSGSLAVRQAVAAKTNITFKVLYNDAVAMTGGQPVDGPISPQAIAWASRAEGVAQIAVLSDDIGALDAAAFPPRTRFEDRAELDSVQRALRDVPGVTVLIYQQTCAAEKRRKRRKGTLEDPSRFVVINDLVCEGCGDCSVESNCLSVEPVQTPFGVKRKINLSSCNKDFTCLGGFCPSFVTVEGTRRTKAPAARSDFATCAERLPLPALAEIDTPYNLLVTGVGGTGVITVGAVIAMAAHLEGHGASVLDFTGFAQKFGTVLSYLRIARHPGLLNQVRIDTGSADAVIGCDAVVSSSPGASRYYNGDTRMVLNLAQMPTGDVVLNRDADLRIDTRAEAIRGVLKDGHLDTLDANRTAEALLGDPVYANVLLLGFAWQRGLVPVGLDALRRALELNGVATDTNWAAFSAGRLLAEAPSELDALLPREARVDETPRDIVSRRAAFLTAYQDQAYADRYRRTLDRFQAAMPLWSEDLHGTVAKSLFKLMAIKDEYEVARLHLDPSFAARIAQDFDGPAKLTYHLAAPILGTAKDARGRHRKRALSGWIRGPLRVLARLRRLRGTFFDPFRFDPCRRLDRALLAWFEQMLQELPAHAEALGEARLLEILRAPMDIRGYGPVRDAAARDVRQRVAGLLSPPASNATQQAA